MRTGDFLKGGLAVAILAGFAAGCVPQSQYDAMVHKYHAKEAEALRLALRNEELEQEIAALRAGGLAGQWAQLKAPTGTEVIEDGAVALGDMAFGSGKHQLTAKGKAALDNIAGQILAKKYYVVIDGHTDSDPITKSRKFYSTNLHLSAMRAIAVSDYLISRGVPQKNVFVVRGFGANKPRADNNSKSGKAKNRRVEIRALEGAPVSPRRGTPARRGGTPGADLK